MPSFSFVISALITSGALVNAQSALFSHYVLPIISVVVGNVLPHLYLPHPQNHDPPLGGRKKSRTDSRERGTGIRVYLKCGIGSTRAEHHVPPTRPIDDEFQVVP